MVQCETDRGSAWCVGSGLIGLYLKSTPLKAGFLLRNQEGDRMARFQEKVTQLNYQVVQNKTCPAYVCRADVKTSNLQKLETWLMQYLSIEV